MGGTTEGAMAEVAVFCLLALIVGSLDTSRGIAHRLMANSLNEKCYLNI